MGSLAFNVLTAGRNANGSAKSATNAIADSAEDGVRREAKDSPGGAVKLRSGWDENRLITVIIEAGKKRGKKRGKKGGKKGGK